FQIAISAVDEIFKFDVAGILIEEDGKGIVKASTSNIQEEIGDTVDINKGVVGLSFSEKKAFLIEDIRDFESVEPKSKKYRSGITIPIGDYGVFQALSKTVGYFDESDLEIAKLFISHLKEALDRLKREKIVQEKKNRIKKLHDVAARIELCQTKDEVYSLGIEAAENILDFDICVFDAVEGDKFVTKAVSSNVPVNGSLDRPIEDGGLDKKTYREQSSYIVDDLKQNGDSKPVKDEYRSAISVPIGKGGIFQAVSKEPNQFDEEDLELAELLINHITEALKRVEMSEREQFLHTLLRHDVGNKIQIIQGYIYLLEADFDLPEKAEDYLQRAKKGIIGSIELIDKVRVLRRTKEEDIKKLDIRPMINETVNDLKDVSEEKGFELTVNIPDDISDVQGGSLLKEVFSNIIENSIKFSEGSLIKITCEESDDRVVCKIEDDGIGIPDEKKDDIFSKGYTSDMERGTGLGLYLVELLLNRYGGKVTVKDSKLGGTRFDIELKKAENS
ncbi:MAG: GAF domain-containing sensor histidine kinase, partial [bacterium]